MADYGPLLEVENLRIYFETIAGRVPSVQGVSFRIGRGETVAIVGESGSGKSVASLSIMRLITTPPGCIAGGRILFDGEDLLAKNERDMRRIRGNDIAMIFQEPMTSLNPVHTIGQQIAECYMIHNGVTRKVAMAKAQEMLELVGIPEPEKRHKNYPHEMSGGMRQRVLIAMALICRPKLLIADEPTTALDVTIQAQILDLLRKAQRDSHMSILFITHDLGVVAEIADRVAVMYAGRIVEEASVDEIFARPLMPYTSGLLGSVIRVTQTATRDRDLDVIAGGVPDALHLPRGCSFHPRCRHADQKCKEAVPLLEDAGGRHLVRCIRWREISGASAI